ncbi:hypothetical protein OQA88_8076 [Cercophora sp. LCS_1]
MNTDIDYLEVKDVEPREAPTLPPVDTEPGASSSPAKPSIIQADDRNVSGRVRRRQDEELTAKPDLWVPRPKSVETSPEAWASGTLAVDEPSR